MRSAGDDVGERRPQALEALGDVLVTDIQRGHEAPGVEDEIATETDEMLVRLEGRADLRLLAGPEAVVAALRLLERSEPTAQAQVDRRPAALTHTCEVRHRHDREAVGVASVQLQPVRDLLAVKHPRQASRDIP